VVNRVVVKNTKKVLVKNPVILNAAIQDFNYSSFLPGGVVEGVLKIFWVNRIYSIDGTIFDLRGNSKIDIELYQSKKSPILLKTTEK
jgi:hypothetical protein